MISLEHYLVLAVLLFLIGCIGVLIRQNLIFILMSIELMLNAVNLVLVAASTHFQHIDGQVMVFFIIKIAACEAGIGLAMVISLFRKYGTINSDFFRTLRG